MATTALEPAPVAAAVTSARLFDPGRSTLEDAILAAWHAIVRDGTAECPVCSARMVADGTCAGCGSQLS